MQMTVVRNVLHVHTSALQTVMMTKIQEKKLVKTLQVRKAASLMVTLMNAGKSAPTNNLFVILNVTMKEKIAMISSV